MKVSESDSKEKKDHSSPIIFSRLRRIVPRNKIRFQVTIAVSIAFIFTFLILSMVMDVAVHHFLFQYDQQILSQIQTFRMPLLNQVMLFITYLGKWQVIFFGVTAVGILLVLWKRIRYLLALLISVIGGELFVMMLKNIIHRPRPPMVNALTYESSFSFPSGHSFVALSFYGLLAYFVYQGAKNLYAKIITIAGGIGIILAIGFSRMYLGVHWPLDVFASYVSGSAWLLAIITFLGIKTQDSTSVYEGDLPQKPFPILAGGVLLFLWVAYIIFFFQTHPLIAHGTDP